MTFIQEILNQQIQKIAMAQQDLVLQRIKERVKDAFTTIEDEAKRRFPRIKIEYHDDVTNYYWNDGSINGIHLITFYQLPIQQNLNEEFKFTTGFNYK